MAAWIVNRRDPTWVPPRPDPAAVVFHRQLPGYGITRLVELPAIASELQVARIFVKDESRRLGLPAFKALGASWAVHRALASAVASDQLSIVTATDGNHGRAVARWAVQFGHRAVVLVPDGVHRDAVDAIRAEGASVLRVSGSYDDALDEAFEMGAEPGVLLVQDTARPGYSEVPGWIVDGYDTLFVEIDEQLGDYGVDGPDLVVVPTGVGSLLQAAIVHYRHAGRGDRTRIVSVEPTAAACVHASLAAGHPVSIDTGTTVMAGLNCGTVSSAAWPAIAAGLDAAVVIADDAVPSAMATLAALGVDAGPCGAAPLAALRGVHRSDGAAFRRHLRVGSDANVVLLSTEGTAANPG